MTRLQRELRDQQAAVIKKAEDEQSAQMQKLVVQVTDESSENQKRALAQFQQETSNRLKELQETQPDWFAKSQQSARKAQEDQDKRLAATLKTIEDTAAWLRDSAKKPETAAQTGPADAAVDTAVKDLTWKVVGVTTTLDRVRGRVNALFGLNLLLLLGLVGILACLGAYLFLPGIRSRLSLPGGAATAAATPGTAPSAPQSAGTDPTAAAPTAAVAATGGVLACSNTDQALRFYDCVVTNTTERPQTFDLTIEPDQVNGFFYSVQVDGQTLPPASGVAGLAPGAAQFALGTFGTQVSRPLRVSLACTSGSGCKTTLFRFVVTAEGPGTIKDNEVRVSTSYSQP